MAGSTISVESVATAVSMPSPSRTSSLLTYTFTNRFRSPDVVEQVRADAGEAIGQVGEHLPDGRARGVDLARSADRLAEDGGHSDG